MIHLSAYRYDEDTLGAWCKHCGIWHWHGARTGHRNAHCISPATNDGYWLVDAGPVTPDIKADMKRRRPKGPTCDLS